MEMEKTIHPHWWKELKDSGRVSMGSHIVTEGLSNSEGLQLACWQVTAFRLPLGQHEALGQWDAPPWLSGHFPMDCLLHTDASGPRDFWTVR